MPKHKKTRSKKYPLGRALRYRDSPSNVSRAKRNARVGREQNEIERERLSNIASDATHKTGLPVDKHLTSAANFTGK